MMRRALSRAKSTHQPPIPDWIVIAPGQCFLRERIALSLPVCALTPPSGWLPAAKQTGVQWLPPCLCALQPLLMKSFGNHLTRVWTQPARACRAAQKLSNSMQSPLPTPLLLWVFFSLWLRSGIRYVFVKCAAWMSWSAWAVRISCMNSAAADNTKLRQPPALLGKPAALEACSSHVCRGKTWQALRGPKTIPWFRSDVAVGEACAMSACCSMFVFNTCVGSVITARTKTHGSKWERLKRNTALGLANRTGSKSKTLEVMEPRRQNAWETNACDGSGACKRFGQTMLPLAKWMPCPWLQSHLLCLHHLAPSVLLCRPRPALA